MNNWHCDICKKETFVNPDLEPLFEEKEFDVPTPIAVGKGKIEIQNKKVVQKVPKMTTMKQQNIKTGKIELIPVQAHKELQERTFIIALRAGQEKIQRDFCRDCLEKHVMPKIKELWDVLENITPVE